MNTLSQSPALANTGTSVAFAWFRWWTWFECFRAKDEAHLKDLDDAGLIAAEIEAALPPVLRERLERARVNGGA